MQNKTLLEIHDLKTHFFLDEGIVKAVDGVDLTIKKGTTMGLVGESGCGKSVTAYSILQLIQKPGRIVDGQVLLHLHNDSCSEEISQDDKSVDLTSLKPNSREMRKVRGGEIGMIFQEPMTSLSMMHTVGFQIMEAFHIHAENMTKQEARERAVYILEQVGIPNPEQRIDNYPFELSGGMRQRVMIAMALSCNPSLLIADEPTTALDVTTQAQILDLMLDLQKEIGMSILIITHDLGVIAEICDEVAVMYLGQIVEQTDVDSLFHNPQHPYTQSLLKSIPRLGYSKLGRLDPIKGAVPDPYTRPNGCLFHPRCDKLIPGMCDVSIPSGVVLAGGCKVRCLLFEDDGKTEHPSKTEGMR